MGQADLVAQPGTERQRPSVFETKQSALGRQRANQVIIGDLLCSRASAMKHKAKSDGRTGAALSKQGQELCE